VCNNTPPFISGIDSASNYQIEAVAGNSLCFDLFAFDPEAPAQSLEVNAVNLPNGASLVIDSSGTLPVFTFCWDTVRPNPSCSPNNAFYIEIKDDNCPVPGTAIFTYNVVVPIVQCRDTVCITNRNYQNGLTVSNGTTSAGSLIQTGYINGCSLPAGEVIIRNGQNVTFIAGDNIVGVPGFTPSTEFIVEQGATFNAFIQPYNCSPECTPPPLSVYIDVDFRCNLEKYIAVASNGVPPYIYSWTLNGNVASTDEILLLTDSLRFADSSAHYELYVSDQLGDAFYFTDQIGSRAGVYADLDTINNVWTNTILTTPMLVTEEGDVNNPNDTVAPPFYKATEYEFIVFDEWGGEIYVSSGNLALDGRSSFNNGEIYWDGYVNQNIDRPFSANLAGEPDWEDGDCAAFDVYNWILTLDNCISDTVITGHVTVIECWDGDISNVWIEPRSMNVGDIITDQVAERDVVSESTEIAESGDQNNRDNSLFVYPNPSDSKFNIELRDGAFIKRLEVRSITGEQLIQKTFNSSRVTLDLSDYAKGIYFVTVFSEDQQYVEMIILN